MQHSRLEVAAFVCQSAGGCEDRSGHEHSIAHFIVKRHELLWGAVGSEDLVGGSAAQGDPAFAFRACGAVSHGSKDEVPRLFASGFRDGVEFAGAVGREDSADVISVMLLCGEFSELQFDDEWECRDVGYLVELLSVDLRQLAGDDCGGTLLGGHVCEAAEHRQCAEYDAG